MPTPRRGTARRAHAPAFARGSTLSRSGPLGESPLRHWSSAAIAALIVPILVAWWLARPEPSLANMMIDGPRGPACLRLVVAADVSGSMAEVTEARDRAFAQLLAWAPANLRDDDELAVVDFAQSAGDVRGPTTVGDGPARLVDRRGDAPVLGDRTLVTPVLDAVRALPSTRCETALALVSDGQYVDLPIDASAGLDALRDAGIRDLALLVPSHSVEVPTAWGQAFPSAPTQTFEGLDADSTGIALGTLIAQLTGQRLVRR